MKRILILSSLLLAICVSSFAQTIVNPEVERSDDMSSVITKVETNEHFTVVSFKCTAHGENSWVQLNKEIFIQTNLSNRHYKYIKSENIAMVPARHNFANAGENLLFSVFFEKIPAEAKSIDIIERPGTNKNGIGYFNFYNVSLTQSHTTPYITDASLTAPQRGFDMAARDWSLGGANNMASAMNAMGPMFSNLTKSMMDAQIEYYKQPGKIVEVAKMNKQYFDALVKEGFNEDQALKIVTSQGLLSKTAMGGK